MADRRLMAARPDLAAASLKGQVEAARFVDGERASVAQGRTWLRRAPSGEAAQDSELLMGERVSVFERSGGWAWVQAESDSYVGYVREDALGSLAMTDARIVQPMVPLLSSPNVKAPLRDLLPLNAAVKRGPQQGNFADVGIGFVHVHGLAPLDQPAADFVAVAELFLGAPYVWGGKTSAGLDCSGLLQTALQAAGHASPRDTDMMEQALGKAVLQESLRRGDLVFWNGHVGIMRDAQTLLHANAHFMQVTSEPLVAARTRITTPITSVRRL